MYPGYNTQQALQDQRVRELLANTDTNRIPPRRIARFFAALRDRLTTPEQATAPSVNPARLRTPVRETRQ